MRTLAIVALGFCFVVIGALIGIYPLVGLGGAFITQGFYLLSRKRRPVVESARKGEGRSVLLVGVIGASFSITGYLEHDYLLGAWGSVLLIGALLRFWVPWRAWRQ